MIYCLKHRFYGCDTGCCGVRLYKQGTDLDSFFSFNEPVHKDIINNNTLLKFCINNFPHMKFYHDDLFMIDYEGLPWCYLSARQIDD